MIIFFFLNQDLKQSGIIRSKDQSPPPITFPALAVATVPLRFFPKKELIYAVKICSQQTFEAL